MELTKIVLDYKRKRLWPQKAMLYAKPLRLKGGLAGHYKTAYSKHTLVITRLLTFMPTEPEQATVQLHVHLTRVQLASTTGLKVGY